MHVCMDWQANEGEVFVKIIPRGERIPTWRRMTAEKAEREGKAIITCVLCDKPAVRVDHSYPWMSEHNRCREHGFGY